MAWRLDTSVIKGEIDNRTPGIISGRVWLVGRPNPIVLTLEGNALRDMAGCLLTFTNPTPAAGDQISLDERQQGMAGDMTASRKVRIPDVPIAEMIKLMKANEPVPEHIGNALYLEWFSEANGRVVIESAGYTVAITLPAWQMTEAQDRAQRAANQAAMQNFFTRLTGGEDQVKAYDPEDDAPMDEFAWEKFMKAADQRADKYGELLDKYKDHPDRERIVAREMGWTWVADMLDAGEHGALKVDADQAGDDLTEAPDLAPNPLTEGVDWVRDEYGYPQHPLTLRAIKISMGMWHQCKDLGLLDETGDEALNNMIFQTQVTGAKLAGALNSLAYRGEDVDAGFVVANLKRALQHLHQAIETAGAVQAKDLLPAQALKDYRASLFALREEILALTKSFRKKQW
ncbi:MAG: hypothetical protein KJ964_03700 [Verrucomicrobia bacterium]|nr:hypothetical protein [Verrucomicrobiota bacterium]MBU1734911.1 hypothetical protein [Verrucomicrobiota bacterium]MBU1857705.1 hypothetical protein [Verrucomicrobiota bacterium]